MGFIKKNYKYLLLFLFFLISLIFFGFNNTDIIWNYGMAHAIRIGEIPYKDFNIITTPLYPFIMSIGLFIKDSYIVYLLEQSLLLTVYFYLLDKLLKDKIYNLLFIFIFPIFYIIFPNYNFLVIFLITLLIYLEKNKSNDYYIGLVLGLLFITKHTIGGILLICSLISTFSIKKDLKRISTFLIPNILLLIYLLITNSFFNFINLSIMGLFDFGKSNNGAHYISGFIFIVIILHLIIRFIKDYKNNNNYYLLGSLSFVIPIIDFFHINYLIAIYFVIILSELDNKYMDILKRTAPALILVTVLINISINIDIYKDIKLCSFNHFEGYITTKSYEKRLNQIYKKYESDNNYMFSLSSMFFDISTNHKITYFDIPLYGNFGYNGVNNMKKRIDSIHDAYFFIQFNDDRQFSDEIYNYIKKVSKKQKELEGYEIYYKK